MTTAKTTAKKTAAKKAASPRSKIKVEDARLAELIAFKQVLTEGMAEAFMIVEANRARAEEEAEQEMPWIKRQFHVRKGLAAFVMIGIVGTLVFNRQDDNLQRTQAVAVQSQATADQVKRLVEENEADRLASAEVTCGVRNSAQRNGRDRFVQLFENLDDQLSTPEGKDFSMEIRKNINLDPSSEDKDCNGDGVLDGKDYAA